MGELEAWLKALRDAGVEEYRRGDFYVRFTPPIPAVPVAAISTSPEHTLKAAPKPLWENPNLWAGGLPPRFPTDK